MSDSKVLREALRVVSGAQKLIRLPSAVPFFFREGDVSALHHVIIQRNDIERRAVGGRIPVRKILEPRNKAGSLGDFVRNFAVLALELTYKFQCRSGSRKITCCIQRERSPQ